MRLQKKETLLLKPHRAQWEVLDPQRGVVARGEAHNEVLRSALDHVAMYGFSDLARYAVVGSGEEKVDQESLYVAEEVARTARDRKGVEGKVSVTEENGSYVVKVEREFLESQVGGKRLTCWGFSPSEEEEVPLAFANLFRSPTGEPEPIVLDEDQRLRITYSYEIRLENRLPKDRNFTLPGGKEIGASFLFRSSGSPERDLAVLDSLATGRPQEEGIGVWLYGDREAKRPLYGKWPPFGEYVPGTGKRKTGKVHFAPDEGHGEIWSIGFGGEGFGFILSLPEAIFKTDLQRLYLEPFSISWKVG